MKQSVSLLRSFIFMFFFFAFSVTVFGKTEITRLVCEYHTNPVGIDVVQPRLSWQLVSDAQNVTQTAYEIRVAETAAGLSKTSQQVWNSGKVESDQSVNVVYGGPEPESMKRLYWQVRVWDNSGKVSNWGEPAYWEMGILEPELWKASWITLPNEPESEDSKPAQYYRNEFSIAKTIKSARAYVTSHGLYQLFLNDEKVGDQLFTPGWTSYNKRLQYQTYDVTELLKKENAVGVVLGDGWYRGNIGWSSADGYYGNNLALLFQLKIDYSDGSSEWIVSDKNWKVKNGPMLKSDIYNGESYDARLELNGWAGTGYNESGWKSVDEIDAPKDILIAPQGVPVKAVEEIKPIEFITTPKGEIVYDMGQNMVGWVRIRMKGKAGQKVQLKFAEVLDKEGNFYTANLRSAECTDTYIFGKDGEAVYEPKFTFHGFRYLQLIGFDEVPSKEDITGVVIYSDMEPTGTFACNDEMINQLQHNIKWGQKGNFLDVPTDCPQRDERLGWTGDAQVFSMTAGYNFNVAAFYTKWMKDVATDQLENGVIPHVIPDVLKGQGGATGWADVVAVIPWSVYKIYGDTRILEESYPAITKWVAYMNKRAGDDYLWTGDSHFGDWLAFATTNSDYPGATTEKDLLATAYFYYTTTLTAKIAQIIGKPQDAEKYKQLAANIKQAFNKEFVTPNGRLVSHTQTAYVIALAFGILPDDIVDAAADYLAKDVEKFKHLTTGFLGTPILCPTLSAIGHDDLAYLLLNRKEYPSWLYPVTQGATTIWERWDGQKPDGSFQDVGMNSFNHYAYGAIGEWLYDHVAGIKVDENNPGYKKFVLAPHPGGGLTTVAASFNSVYGTIKSDWKISEGQMTYTVEVPANTSAQVVLPKAKVADVTMTDDLKSGVKQTGTDVTVAVGSGTYSFTYPMGE
ncbi:glycoside hydrolase family 78 protein [Draconibacterium sp. IB214405]|uniref:glycoside hydrolase family 78 protein n=1 Tax=Draconibacterium sp. IB214405 TaxID=3097352 RepID=UPI002A112E76|nr:glycoside hydrolase family 78 protein [Draconibacterium sp. IB214405]MDX8340248.1 glycoside hydrolase family 78 protein [Draconibacterium sp. IB214405]